jgi:hypothetical protein
LVVFAFILGGALGHFLTLTLDPGKSTQAYAPVLPIPVDIVKRAIIEQIGLAEPNAEGGRHSEGFSGLRRLVVSWWRRSPEREVHVDGLKIWVDRLNADGNVHPSSPGQPALLTKDSYDIGGGARNRTIVVGMWAMVARP